MKKAIAVVVAVLVVVLSVTVVGSTLSWASSFADLMNQYTDVVTWAAQDPHSRYLTAASRMQNILDTATEEAVQAILEAATTTDAKIAVAMVYDLVGMQLGTEGMRELDGAKIGAAGEIMRWGSKMTAQLIK